MIRKLITITLLFIALLYYLNKEGYIIITDKTKKKIDQKLENVKGQGKRLAKKGVKSALEKGNELINETWQEYKEENKIKE